MLPFARVTLPALCAVVLLGCGGAVEPSSSSFHPSSRPPEPQAGGTPGPVSTTTPKAPPAPLTWSTQSGCGNVVVYAADATGTTFLVVRTTARHEPTNGASVYADLSAPSALTVYLEVHPAPPGEPPYCSDVGVDGAGVTRWAAVAGNATLTQTSAASGTFPNATYSVRVDVAGLVVEGPDGVRQAVPDVRFESVRVGWLPG